MEVDAGNYLPSLIALVKRVGDALLEMYAKSSQFPVRAKPDASPLTQADLLAHDMILEGLNQITPGIPVLSEEGILESFSKRQQWQYYWLVDPVDGTKEFVRHSGEFSINIALIKNHSAILGIIYLPVMQKIYFASKNQGAFIQEQAQPSKKLQVRTWSQKKTIIAVGNYPKLEKLKNIFDRVGDYEIIERGSAWKLGLVAEGTVDLYPRIGITSEWDTAAGQIIVEEAGGIVVDFTFQPLRYNTKDSIYNPPFLAVGDKQLLNVFKGSNDDNKKTH